MQCRSMCAVRVRLVAARSFRLRPKFNLILLVIRIHFTSHVTQRAADRIVQCANVAALALPVFERRL